MSIDDLQLWAVLVGTIALVMVAVEAGYRIGRARILRSPAEKESPVSAVAGAILGLAAFMLAFTFNVVADRWDTKRGLVRAEAAAVRAAWQRSDFLPEGDRAEAADLLRSYLELRLDFARELLLHPEALGRVRSETQALQERLWSMAVANARKDMNSDVAALSIESLNEMNGIHARRVAVGIQARVPKAIWLVLLAITFLD
jgi:hypothetical protein